MKITHLVFKKKDVIDICTPHQIATLQAIGDLIYKYRRDTGREPDPRYIVINRDEPYSGNIVEVLKHNGHWDEPNVNGGCND